MRSLEEIRARTPKREIFHGQAQHAMLVILLISGAVGLLNDNTRIWAYLAIAIAVVHQIMVAVVFRLQLHRNTMVNIFGDRALKVWGTIFLPFMAARPLSIILVGLFDYGSLSGSGSFNFILGIILILPAAWAMHSVLKYFTINRALGGDHFFDEYANLPMVNKGAFKYFPNAMYSIVFTGFWGIALLFDSQNALAVALFYHAYIWVHMYCTEEPDMRIIYGNTPEPFDEPASANVLSGEIMPELKDDQT
ncbi:MAG: hypothetical protein JKY31_03615 [Rhodobacteraceae bacterium]|nr:hypothetical protein [Paracoccaceae bacterium]